MMKSNIGELKINLKDKDMSNKIISTVGYDSYSNTITEIPDEVLEKLGWSEENELIWTIVDGEVRVRKVGGISREKIADAALYLYKSLPPITGQRQAEMTKVLREYSNQKIVNEAGFIQETYYSKDADAALKIWIGE